MSVINMLLSIQNVIIIFPFLVYVPLYVWFPIRLISIWYIPISDINIFFEFWFYLFFVLKNREKDTRVPLFCCIFFFIFNLFGPLASVLIYSFYFPNLAVVLFFPSLCYPILLNLSSSVYTFKFYAIFLVFHR